MLSYLLLAFVGLCIACGSHTYRCFAANLAAAKQSGIPYICQSRAHNGSKRRVSSHGPTGTPVYTFNRFWLITHRLWLPLLDRLPTAWTASWIGFLVPEFLWHQQYDTFRKLGSDNYLLVSPGPTSMIVADAEATTQITQRRNDFPKPIWMYSSIDVFGKNVVSTEGAVWRHHRKITSPPFTERNNHLVWVESLHQATSMVGTWVSETDQSSKTIWDVAAQAMRLSLHVISRAGFGVRLAWPHEEADQNAPPGHTLTYKDALSSLLENIIVVMLTPRWLLSRSPLRLHKVANDAYVEWGKYMREMYQDKRGEVKAGGSREGMDLMGALVKGAGITAESLHEDEDSDPEKIPSPSTKQLLTDDEILGNAFVFILAGHETAANTIHFSLLFLAMYPSSQRRLQKDLDDIFGDKPISEWDYDEDVPKLFGSMCGAVMNEQLRLIPPVVGIPKSVPRGSPQGLQAGAKHVTVPGGANVTLATAALHRNPKYWPHTSDQDLLEFRPERWLLDGSHGSANEQPDAHDHAYAAEEGLDFDGPDRRADTSAQLYRPPKGAYIPFSDGYRSCLGRRFAQVEILAVLAVIFKTWSVELDVGLFLPEERLEAAGEGEKREAWGLAKDRAERLLREAMMTIITIQMRGQKVPMRFVRRGGERFDYPRA
ncbi:putative P450 monooxygenase [Teratosphaeria nubilosa]|uniref:Putative P450 monooxygenase n=1 Tax=Teratosphaeria nubilosa TaxID=161662 RepID=A0A6G1LBU6_9PEZI|nr:putative P450 monooxygenase [Teratosphaeria nubilosa]